MALKILAHLHNQYGGRATREINYFNSFEKAKQELYYVEFEGSYYEWSSFDAGHGGFDYIAEYTRVFAIPGNAIVYKIHSGWYNAPTCICGGDKVRHSGHSHWCPKFKPY